MVLDTIHFYLYSVILHTSQQFVCLATKQVSSKPSEVFLGYHQAKPSQKTEEVSLTLTLRRVCSDLCFVWIRS